MPLRRQPSRLSLFYKERLGTGSPPHPPQCAHWATFPQRGRLWVGKSWGIPSPSVQRTRPAGHASEFPRPQAGKKNGGIMF